MNDGHVEGAAYEVTVDRQEIVNGAYSLKMTMAGTETASQKDRFIIVKCKSFPVIPGKTYRLGYKLKTRGIQSLKAADGNRDVPGSQKLNIIFYFMDAKGNYVSNKSHNYFAEIQSYVSKSEDIVIPENSFQAFIQISLSNSSTADSATIWINDVTAVMVMPDAQNAKPANSGVKSYEPDLETYSQYKERSLVNYALTNIGATAWANSMFAYQPGRQDYVAGNAIDGDENTGWVGEVRENQKEPYRLKITLPEPRQICGAYWMRFQRKQGDERCPENYTIQVSLDDQNWKTVADVKNFRSSNRYDFFETVSAKYVLIEITKVQGESSNGPEIKEFKVLGLKDTIIDEKGWWNKDWTYRLRVTLPADGKQKTARLPVNFSALVGTTAEQFLAESIRIIPADQAGSGQGLPYRFIPASDYDGRDNAAGELLFIPEIGTQVQYYCYFDFNINGRKPKPEFSVTGLQTSASFSRTGYQVALNADPQNIKQITVLDINDREIKVFKPADNNVRESLDLNFDVPYYLVVNTADNRKTCLWLEEPGSDKVTNRLQVKRKAFYRNEKVDIRVLVVNQGDSELKGKLTIAIRDLTGKDWYIKEEPWLCKNGEIKEAVISFDRVNLKENPYLITLALKGEDDVFLASPRKMNIKIVEDKKIQFLYGIFGPGGAGQGSKEWDTMLQTIRDAGFNAISGNTVSIMDDFLEHGLKGLGKIGFPAPSPMKKPEDLAATDEDGNYALPPYGGKVWYPNYTHPEVKAKAAESFKKYLAPIANHPAFSGYVFCNDDFTLPAKYEKGSFSNFPGYSRTDRELFKKITGSEPPKSKEVTVKKGIIPDDDPWARFVLFRCDEIYGKGNHKVMVDAKNEVAPWVKFGNVHGPMQDTFYCPLAGLYPPVQQSVCDFIGAYTYYNQWREWKRYTTYGDLARMGKRNRENGRELFLATALHCSAGFKKTGEGSYEYGSYGDLASDWQFRNQFYQLLAGGFNGLWFYLWSDPRGGGIYPDPTYKPELMAEMKALGKIVEQYGPFLKSIHTSDKPVGIFVSITDSAYGSHFLNSGHKNDNGAWLNDTLLKAHIPAETFAEEEVLEGILAKYRVVVVDDVIVMKQAIAKKMEEYIAKGGKVLLVRSEDIPLKGAEVIKLAKTHLSDELIARLKELIIPLADTSSEEITIREFDDGLVKYLFFVDCFFDKYTFTGGNRETLFKKWKEWKESPFIIQLKDKKETITLNQKFAHAIDLFGQKELALTASATGGVFSLELQAGGGKLIALYPQKPGQMTMEIPRRVTAGESINVKLRVLGEDNKPFVGNLPVAVEYVDPAGQVSRMSDYYVAKDGKLEVTIQTANNDVTGNAKIVARELATGKKAEKNLEVAAPEVAQSFFKRLFAP